MKTRHLPVMVAAAMTFAALPMIDGPTPFTGTAEAQGASGGPGGGSGGGPGGAGGAAGAGGVGAGAASAGVGGVGNAGGAPGHDTAAKAVAPDTTGLDKAAAVLEMTPADETAKDAVADARDRQAAAGTGQSNDSNGMGFGQAMSNMATDARNALSTIFGGGSGGTSSP